jgi:hypothetical protein
VKYLSRLLFGLYPTDGANRNWIPKRIQFLFPEVDSISQGSKILLAKSKAELHEQSYPGSKLVLNIPKIWIIVWKVVFTSISVLVIALVTWFFLVSSYFLPKNYSDCLKTHTNDYTRNDLICSYSPSTPAQQRLCEKKVARGVG